MKGEKMTEKAEKLLKEYDKLEMDIFEPYEAAAIIAGTVYMDCIMRQIPREEATQIAVHQLKKHLSIKFIGQVLKRERLPYDSPYDTTPDEAA